MRPELYPQGTMALERLSSLSVKFDPGIPRPPEQLASTESDGEKEVRRRKSDTGSRKVALPDRIPSPPKSC